MNEHKCDHCGTTECEWLNWVKDSNEWVCEECYVPVVEHE